MIYLNHTYHLTAPLTGVGIAIARIGQLLATLEELVNELIRPPAHYWPGGRAPDNSVKRSVGKQKYEEALYLL